MFRHPSTRALLVGVYAALTLAAPSSNAPPTITLDQGTFTGVANGTINQFLGIPFAKPPVGDLRFRLPVPNDPYSGTYSATAFGNSCPQQASNFSFEDLHGVSSEAIDFFLNMYSGAISPPSEDCLTVNVWAPANTPPGTRLPVVVWIYGGGFETGSSSTYDGGIIVKRSIEMGKPIIVASMNYRVSAFGFLASKEVKAAGLGNIGLQDQREALRWIQKYIGAFGGDPTKVTIWGLSAGAISVALHMVANNGNTEGLFRGGFMMSGSPIPVGDITNGQEYYDALVSQTGCSGSLDTLACLRTVPYTKLQAAMDASPDIYAYQSLRLAWLPRADGKFLTDHPQKLVDRGIVAKIPFISGDCDDEGTEFSLSTLNITTDTQFREYISTNYITGASTAQLDELFTCYPADPSAGSPFDTGDSNVVTPQYKRLSAIQGDIVFQAPRRFFMQKVAIKQNVWSYLSKRYKSLADLGSFHGTDIFNIYGGGELTDYLINFATNLDPNGNTVPSWPRYTLSSQKVLTFLDGSIRTTISIDNYREKGMALLTKLMLAHPF